MNSIAPRRSTILVVHHDPLLCAGLVTALRQDSSFDVFDSDVSTASSVVPPIDVVIADYQNAMRLAVAPASGRRPPLATARILALTSHDREADIRRAIEAGIHGYLLVGGPIDELIGGVTMVAKGLRFLCAFAAQRMADSLAHETLTLRENEVLRLVTIGESNKAIAYQLQIELGTVKSHMRAILTKLGAASRTQAAVIAASRGLVEERRPVAPSPLTSHVSIAESRAQMTWARRQGRAAAHA